MLNREGNNQDFAEAGRLMILARGRSVKNSVSDFFVTSNNMQDFRTQRKVTRGEERRRRTNCYNGHLVP
jgi:hypothetical protein